MGRSVSIPLKDLRAEPRVLNHIYGFTEQGFVRVTCQDGVVRKCQEAKHEVPDECVSQYIDQVVDRGFIVISGSLVKVQ